MLISVAKTFLVTGTTADRLDDTTDLVADALLDLEATIPELKDSTLEAALTDAIVTIRVTIEADSLEDGVDLGDSTIRTAIHAADGSTPEWTGPDGANVEFITQNQEAQLISA